MVFYINETLLQYRKNKSDQNKIKSTKIMYVTESKRTKKNISLFGSDLGAIGHDVELDHVTTYALTQPRMYQLNV